PALCQLEDTAQPTDAPTEVQELSSPAPPQPVLLSPSHFLHIAVCDAPALLGMTAEGSITQILLEDGQAIPVQIVDSASIREFMGA
ncbi:hypothetical protein M9458_019691, partial [Cirrhinus mrigala]